MTTHYGANYHNITVECYATGIASLAGRVIGNPAEGDNQMALELLEENHEQLSEFTETWNFSK